MAFKSQYDKTGESFESGDKAESSFETAIRKANLSCKKTSFQEEIRHIDFWIEGERLPRTAVDVKSRKKAKRADDKYNDEVVWIEFSNVQGKRGWLYGESNIIAFERENDFLLVNRKLLARLCEKLCDLSQLNVGFGMPMYTGYQRKGRKDLLSLIKMTDIINEIKHTVLIK
jgi:hypothetical protein